MDVSTRTTRLGQHRVCPRQHKALKPVSEYQIPGLARHSMALSLYLAATQYWVNLVLPPLHERAGPGIAYGGFQCRLARLTYV